MKIEILYPELCNLYGDLANARYLARSSGAELIETHLSETPRFCDEDVAIVTLGGTTERGQEIARDALKPHLEAVKRRIAGDGVTLITGNAMELFGEYIENEDGSKIEMLGLFPIHAKRDMLHRYNSLYLGETEGMKIVGYKSQFTQSYGDNGEGLFTTLRGPGLNPEVKAEGVRVNNFMMTYLLGPLMILNPPFAKYILRLAGQTEPSLSFEETAMEVYDKRVKEFSDPKTGFSY